MMHWAMPQQKVVAEIDETEGQELAPWQCLYNYDNKITRACLRLEQISDSERVLGYEESAQMYHDTAVDLKMQREWWRETYQDAVKKASNREDIKFDMQIADLGWA